MIYSRLSPPEPASGVANYGSTAFPGILEETRFTQGCPPWFPNTVPVSQRSCPSHRERPYLGRLTRVIGHAFTGGWTCIGSIENHPTGATRKRRVPLRQVGRVVD